MSPNQPPPDTAPRRHATLLFAIIAIPFSLLTLLNFIFLGFATPPERIQIYLHTAIGIIYFIVSIICFRHCHHPRYLLIYGIPLNLAFSYIWLPALLYLHKGGWLLVLPGIALTATWLRLLIRTHHSHHIT